MANPIFNSDDFNRGFDDGKKDGYSNKDRNFSKMGASWKFAIHGTNALDSYTDGYKKGYLYGKEIKATEKTPPNVNVVNNITTNYSTQKNITNMTRGIDGQIELLQQMRSYLQQLQGQFEEIEKKQQYFLNQLDSEQIDVKLLQRFEEYFQDTNHKLKDLVQKIDNDDIPYTEQVIRHLEDTPR